MAEQLFTIVGMFLVGSGVLAAWAVLMCAAAWTVREFYRAFTE